MDSSDDSRVALARVLPAVGIVIDDLAGRALTATPDAAPSRANLRFGPGHLTPITAARWPACPTCSKHSIKRPAKGQTCNATASAKRTIWSMAPAASPIAHGRQSFGGASGRELGYRAADFVRACSQRAPRWPNSTLAACVIWPR